jgi:hypothetical protein
MLLFKILISLFHLILFIESKWSVERAKKWYSEENWLVGCNYVPYYAGNQLEMWQVDTFDVEILNQELQFAEDIGFNILRVFLHYLLWLEDSIGFKQRIETFLDIADSHKIKIMFVFFDDCWNGYPKLGPQGEPKPGIHNSMWLQCPGQEEVSNRSIYPILKDYVQDIMMTYRDDSRVKIWDLYNEPGQVANNHQNDSLPLLKEVYKWAREINCIQPLTIGAYGWGKKIIEENFDLFSFENSDIISFHSYHSIDSFVKTTEKIESIANGRPIICTEYMARTRDSTFKTHLPFMKSKKLGAINWGFVNGRSQTIYPWRSPLNASKPKIWFHDILEKDGTPFDKEEIDLIKELSST